MKQTLTFATFLALGTALISGISNFVGKVGVTAVKDPIVFTTLKNAVVAMLLIGAILCFRRWRELKALTRKQWFMLIAIGVIGGSIPFALFFTGLAHTTALNASLIHKSLFVWVLLFGTTILKERLTSWQWMGLALIVVANLFIGGFTGFKYNTGEFMILAATILWAVENVIAKVALKNISSLTVAGARMVFGSVILLHIALPRNATLAVAQLTSTQWGWTLLASALLFGYVVTWYAALKRAPATYVAVLLVPATLVTNMLSAMFVTHTLSHIQLFNGIFVAAGAALIIIFSRRFQPKNDVLPEEQHV